MCALAQRGRRTYRSTSADSVRQVKGVAACSPGRATHGAYAGMVIERRVIVVEDEPMTRNLVAALLSGAGFETSEAATAAEAIKLVREWDPDALVVDLNLGSGPGGAEVVAAAERLAPGAALVVLTNSPTPQAAGIDPSMIPARAAYLNKAVVLAGDALIDALEATLADRSPRRDDRDGVDPFSSLSEDQLDVLRMVAEGLSNAEIGLRRGTSAHAVEQVFQRVLRALGVSRDPSINQRVVAARMYYAKGSHPSQ